MQPCGWDGWDGWGSWDDGRPAEARCPLAVVKSTHAPDAPQLPPTLQRIDHS